MFHNHVIGTRVIQTDVVELNNFIDAPTKSRGSCWEFSPPGVMTNQVKVNHSFSTSWFETIIVSSYCYIALLWSGPPLIRHTCSAGSAVHLGPSYNLILWNRAHNPAGVTRLRYLVNNTYLNHL